MKLITKTPVAVAITAALFAAPAQAIEYELWTSDQSNSVAGKGDRGVDGSFMAIFDSIDVEDYIENGGAAPSPLDCNNGATSAGTTGCDLHAIFPGTLTEHDDAGATGETLGSTSNDGAGGQSFGRLHGALPDPQHKYVNMNMFGPGQGYVGIMKASTKEAVALFRVTGTNAGRSNHMSFWSADGNALYIANLHGRILERIDFTRNEHGDILTATYNQSASMGVGASSISDGAKVYLGTNGAGNAMIGSVSGAYSAEATALLTPNGKCRQNGCGAGPDGSSGGRPGNVIVCPIVSSNDKVYVTFGGGGLLVADASSTPMEIVGEYGREVINGAGCGGVEVGGSVYLNAGASASGAGATQSTFTMYKLTTNYPDAGGPSYPENFPRPRTLFKDPGNTATIGNLSGPASNGTGQLPDGSSTRRDAHGMIATVQGHYIHNVDRVQNNVRVYNTANGTSNEYDLTTGGACASVAATGVDPSYDNDPAPDLMDRSPNGDYLFFAARGPAPVTVTHTAQGSCPGVGVIKTSDGGASGSLAGVVRTSNTVDTAPASTPGGYAYTGTERSDPHGVSVVIK